MHDSDVRLGRDHAPAEAHLPRLRGRLLDLDARERKARQALARRLGALRAEYLGRLSALMGAAGLRRYREMRKSFAKVPRARRIRESSALLDAIGLDRERASKLRKKYTDATRKLLGLGDLRIPKWLPLYEDPQCPWVTYSAPYAGYFWSYAWNRSDEASDPVLARYLDPATGHIGSSIQTELSGADDDDSLDAEYYTSLNVWHTALATAPLEGYLVFEFRKSPYSGQVTDEYGFSDATWNQWARARFRVLDAQGPLDTQETRVFNVVGTAWGEDKSWGDQVAVPRDVHWYYFKTAATFERGSALLLEAGIRNVVWFVSNDESIVTADDLDLRLQRIVVRSCPSQGPVILKR